MNYQERKEFRRSHTWKEFKHKCRLHTSRDYITKQPLVATWNLHHLDLNVSRYDVLEMDRFMLLNPKTHELIHELYKLYKRDPKVLDRIKETLQKMKELTGDETGNTQEDR